MTEECGQIEQMLNTLNVTVASKPNVPAAEATQAGVEIIGAGPAEIRAGLKHMLKNMRGSADKPETVQTNGSRAPTTAE